MIEPSVSVARAEIGRDHLSLGVVLNEEPDRDATVGEALLDLVEPLPGGDRLAAVDPFDQDERQEVGPFHVRMLAQLA